MNRLFSKVFRKDEGSTTVVFSLCFVSVVMACGAAIDFGRWQNAQTEAAAIVDAAALSAVSAGDVPVPTMEAIATEYIKSNVAALDLSIEGGLPRYSYNSDTKEFTVDFTGKMPTSIMSLAGISKVDVNVTATAIRPSLPPIEMVLALDTTGSMAGSKIAALKVAATNMVTSVLKGPDSKIGIVPFSNYVNIGVGRRKNKFFSVPDDYSVQTTSCSTTYPDKKGCSIVTTKKTCTSTNDGVTTTYPCTSSTEVCTSWGNPVKTCKPAIASYKFSGCIGSREEAYRARIDDSSRKYPGFLNTSCASEMLDLTSNATLAKSKIASLTASGETYLPNGLTWGWNMLDSEDPLNSAATMTAMKAKSGMKVLVLMTDGATTLAPSTKDMSTHVAPASSIYKSVDYSNTLSAQLCSNIKSAGIEIYTVQFNVADASLQNLLVNCASSASKAYQADNANELAFAFDKILADLTQVRLAQ